LLDLSRDAAPVACVFEANDHQWLHEQIGAVRRDPKLFWMPCFILGDADARDAPLLDGDLPPPPELKQAIDSVLTLSASFKHQEGELSRTDRLLKYLWLRPGFVIQPMHDWRHPRYYRYPILEALAGTEEDVFGWLQTLANSRTLEIEGLVDRQRECLFCHSAHLSFTDICPNCRAIAVEKVASLHCFTCGHVGEQDGFLSQGGLVCPKCGTRLRHIGSDYDRPLEHYRCRECRHFFVEGDVSARCAMCRKSMPPEDLIAHNIHSWRLSERGRVLAVRGDAGDVFSAFGELHFIANELFIHNLDWLIAQVQRYPDVQFAVLGLSFPNVPELVDVMGHGRTLSLVESFSARLRDLLRTPDLSTRTADNRIWLLLPHTDTHGLQGLLARIKKSALLTRQADGQELVCRFAEFVSTDLRELETAELLLARLRSELD